MRGVFYGWEMKVSSQGGRLMLIKSVLQSLPQYLFQAIQPPKSVSDRMEKLINRFFWGSDGNTRRVHWMSWNQDCFPVEEGGLGVRALSDVVKVILMKLSWRFKQSESLWAKFMTSQYCEFQHRVNVKLQQHKSIIWRRVWSAREVAEPQLFWTLGMEW